MRLIPIPVIIRSYEYKLHLGGILIFEFVEKKWLSIYPFNINFVLISFIKKRLDSIFLTFFFFIGNVKK